MNQENIKEFKIKLEKEKEMLEKQLSSFAKKDSHNKDDWKANYPSFEGIGGQSIEDEAEEVEEYVNLLPLEANLELRIYGVNKALEKIKKGNYGRCEKCKKDIPSERLKAFPSAKTCLNCR